MELNTKHNVDEAITVVDPLIKLRNFTYMGNEISGQYAKLTKVDFQNQVEIIRSEFQELVDGVETENNLEILDGAVDLLVTTLGMIRKLKEAGFNVDRAMEKVGMNNLTKFPTSLTVVDDSVKMYADKGVTIRPVFSHHYDRWALMDEGDKYKKPVGFKDVDLTDCLPKEFKL